MLRTIDQPAFPAGLFGLTSATSISRNAHETVRHHVEQMPTPVGAAIFTVGHSNHAPQAESDDAEGGPAADHHRIERAGLRALKIW
jgi:hypothetical protein